MTRKINREKRLTYFITGGARSGKSRYAMKLALELSPRPVYLATARKWDADFVRRIQQHVADRSGQWTTIEVEKEIGKVNLQGKVVVIDCVTLWLTNFFADNNQNSELSFDQAKEQIDELLKQAGTFIIISNEIGMGMHAPTDMGRKFTDLQGHMNQYIAERSDKVILMVAGIAVMLKGRSA